MISLSASAGVIERAKVLANQKLLTHAGVEAPDVSAPPVAPLLQDADVDLAARNLDPARS